MSRLIHPITESGEIAIATAQAALNFPPTEHAALPASWESRNGLPGEFDLMLAADGAANLTNAELLAAVQIDGAIADDDVDTVDFANNELDIATHGLMTGDGPLRLTTTDTLPTGLALNTDYWVIYVNSGTIQLAATLAGAWAKTAVAFSDVGVGTHTITDTGTSPRRTRYDSLGLLSGDGSVALTAQKGYIEQRLKTSPRALSYAVAATISANNVSASMAAVIDR